MGTIEIKMKGKEKTRLYALISRLNTNRLDPPIQREVKST